MKYISSALLVAGLITGPASTASLHAEKEQQEDMGDSAQSERHEKMLKKLGLSDEQMEKMKAATKTHMETIKPLRKELRADMKKLREQIKNRAGDAAVAATLGKLELTRKAIQAENEKMKAATVELLTPTQQAKMLLKMMKQMHDGPGKGRRHGGDNEESKD